jgi:hypothetical protein
VAVLILALSLKGSAVMATEEPAYTLVSKQGETEVRDYPATITADVTVEGSRDEAANAGFRLLARYIFGGNTRHVSVPMTAPVVQSRAAGESIAMTAPVLQSGHDGAWVVRFTMPSSYTLATLPQPNDPRVRLTPVPAGRVAVVRFSGLAGEPEVARRTAELESFVATRHLRAAGPASLARYNPPWTLWFMRRNEVVIPLEPVRSTL